MNVARLVITRFFLFFIAISAVLVLSGCIAMAFESTDTAGYVTAEEITGVVVEVGSGKPLADAVAVIRFERRNTGHNSPQCFRSMAVKTDAQGRFRFAPWKQENTRANAAFGEINAYKAGYAVPWRSVDVKHLSRDVGRFALSDTITIPSAEIRVELKVFAGNDEERISELQRIVSHYSCRTETPLQDLDLLHAVREEIRSAAFASRKLNMYATVSMWIDSVIEGVTR